MIGAPIGALASAGRAAITAPNLKYTVLNSVTLSTSTQLTKLSVSGGSNTGAASTDTTAPLVGGQPSHVRFTNANTNGSAWGLTLPSTWDFSNSVLRLTVRCQNYTNGRSFNVRLATSASSYAAGNYLSYSAKAKSSDSNIGNWFVTNTWVHDAVSPAIMATTGTAPALTSIGYVVIFLGETSLGACTFDVAKIEQVQRASTKAKLVIWHDDTVSNGASALYAKCNAYGFPLAEATEWEAFGGGGVMTTSELATYRSAGWQFGSHATTSAEHVASTQQQIANQAYRNKVGAMRMGVKDGPADFAYWGGLSAAVAFDQIRISYRSGRWNTSNLVWPDTLPVAEPWLTKALLVTASSDTFSGTWQPYLTNAVNSLGLAQLVFHQDVATNSTLATEVDSLLTWLDANRANIDVVTIANAFSTQI